MSHVNLSCHNKRITNINKLVPHFTYFSIFILFCVRYAETSQNLIHVFIWQL